MTYVMVRPAQERPAAPAPASQGAKPAARRGVTRLLFQVLSKDGLQGIQQFSLNYVWTTQPKVKSSDNSYFIIKKKGWKE